MGVLLQAARDGVGHLKLNVWHYRTIAAEVAQLEVLDAEAQGRLELINCGEHMSAVEAQKIADALQRTLARVSDTDRLLLDGSVTDTPDDGTLHKEDWDRNYSTNVDMLQRFRVFCDASGGFTIY